jgi:hypothetical protein
VTGGRDLEGAQITLNEYLDRRRETAVKPRVREKTHQDYEGRLRRYILPNLWERLLGLSIMPFGEAQCLAHWVARKCKPSVIMLVLDGGSEWGSNPPATGKPAARRF